MPTATKRSENIDAYLAAVPATHRPTLMKLRGQIKKLQPRATEHISYGKPLFKLDGHPLAGFQANRHHSGFFVWSSTTLSSLSDMLVGYDTTQSTIRFAPDRPLPVRIIKAVLKARATEIKDHWGPNKPAKGKPS
jgi:uncharacterized protein YdhG (YjbR/CyaY superfamily)